jgi:hypothetical protein
MFTAMECFYWKLFQEGRTHIENGDDDTYFPVLVASKLLVGDSGSLVDHKLQCDVNLNKAERVCKVAYWCIQDNELN